MIDLNIRNFIPAHKVSPKGWLTYNAPCCHHRGNTADTRGRGGLIVEPDGSWTAHCFNCGFKTKWVAGDVLGYGARRYLKWLGVDENLIQLMVVESLKNRSMDAIIKAKEVDIVYDIKQFEDRELPDGAEVVTESSPETIKDYITSNRGLALDVYPFMCTPKEAGRKANSVILPFTYEGRIVGSTRRFLDDKKPKYISDQQSDYVFGVDLQKAEWLYAIVVEGPFDAISIDGLAIMGNQLSDMQVRILENLNKELIYVPDRNKAGLGIVDKVVELGWSVSIPEWDDDIVDVNDAVKRYGKYYTIATILHAKETHKIKIEMRKRNLARQLQQ